MFCLFTVNHLYRLWSARARALSRASQFILHQYFSPDKRDKITQQVSPSCHLISTSCNSSFLSALNQFATQKILVNKLSESAVQVISAFYVCLFHLIIICYELIFQGFNFILTQVGLNYLKFNLLRISLRKIF